MLCVVMLCRVVLLIGCLLKFVRIYFLFGELISVMIFVLLRCCCLGNFGWMLVVWLVV